jgi:hypothetical protein
MNTTIKKTDRLIAAATETTWTDYAVLTGLGVLGAAICYPLGFVAILAFWPLSVLFPLLSYLFIRRWQVSLLLLPGVTMSICLMSFLLTGSHYSIDEALGSIAAMLGMCLLSSVISLVPISIWNRRQLAKEGLASENQRASA